MANKQDTTKMLNVPLNFLPLGAWRRETHTAVLTDHARSSVAHGSIDISSLLPNSDYIIAFMAKITRGCQPNDVHMDLTVETKGHPSFTSVVDVKPAGGDDWALLKSRPFKPSGANHIDVYLSHQHNQLVPLVVFDYAIVIPLQILSDPC